MGTSLRAQTFDEFFKQKKTQIKYLEQQIAALQALITVTEAGYTVVQKGTGLIAGIKNDDLAMHSDYFASLKAVNPSVSGYPAVGGIRSLNDQVATVAAQVKSLAPPVWAATVAEAVDGLLGDCGRDMDYLNMLMTDGAVQMTDAERVKAIEGIYGRMKRRLEMVVGARDDVEEMGRSMVEP